MFWNNSNIFDKCLDLSVNLLALEKSLDGPLWQSVDAVSGSQERTKQGASGDILAASVGIGEQGCLGLFVLVNEVQQRLEGLIDVAGGHRVIISNGLIEVKVEL